MIEADMIQQDGFSFLPVEESRRCDWEHLFKQYKWINGGDLSASAMETVWDWLTGERRRLHGFLCFIGDRPVGLLHYRETTESVDSRLAGFLDDLFVDPAYRKRGIATALIDRLAGIGRANGWIRIAWLTHDNNFTARRLYDRIAGKTLWNTYEMELG